MNSSQNQAAGLYVHVPFCLRKCPYCDFFSVVDLSLKPAFLAALMGEMALTGPVEFRFDTLYIGGGTPSLLTVSEIARIVEQFQRRFAIQPGAELTLEINPGTVSLEKLKGYRAAGINRLSIGGQSFQAANLKFLGRIHSAGQADRAVDWARQAGFDNIGLDLIYALPDQPVAAWMADLKRALEWQPAHLSCYMLTMEPGTPLYRDLQNGRVHPPPEDRVREQFEATVDYLAAHGYRQYEISNFARRDGRQPGIWRSRHNLKYWSHAPYLGFGPGAHSFLEPVRRWNLRDLQDYIGQIEAGRAPACEKEVLTRGQLMLEAVYLQLRMIRGIDIGAFSRRFKVDFNAVFVHLLADLSKKGLLELSQQHCRLTRRGLAFADGVAAMFAGALPERFSGNSG